MCEENKILDVMIIFDKYENALIHVHCKDGLPDCFVGYDRAGDGAGFLEANTGEQYFLPYPSDADELELLSCVSKLHLRHLQSETLDPVGSDYEIDIARPALLVP